MNVQDALWRLLAHQKERKKERGRYLLLQELELVFVEAGNTGQFFFFPLQLSGLKEEKKHRLHYKYQTASDDLRHKYHRCCYDDKGHHKADVELLQLSYTRINDAFTIYQ